LPVPALDVQTGNPVTMLHVGFAYWALGERTPAHAAFECALTVSRRDANRDGMVLAACFLADLERQAGRLLLAAKRYQQLLPEESRTEHRHVPVESYALVGLGRLWYEWNDMEKTWRLLQASMEPARRGGNTDALLTSLVTQALVQQARGAPADAQTIVTEALRIARQCNVPIWLNRVEALQAQLWLAQGQLPAAVRWARSCGLRGDGPISPQREHDYLVLARIRIAQGAVQTALRTLERIALAAQGDGRTERVIEALILMALAHQARGRAEPARAALEQALLRAEPGGYIRTFLDAGAPLAELLRDMLMYSRVPGYVAILLTAFGGAADGGESKGPPNQASALANPPPTTTTSEALAEQLTTRELEILRCVAAGMPTAAIATQCTVAASTVNWHLQNVYAKLGVRSRTQALARARELGLLP
jgi:LuxR family maltose regulon positive regulatory protein